MVALGCSQGQAEEKQSWIWSRVYQPEQVTRSEEGSMLTAVNGFLCDERSQWFILAGEGRRQWEGMSCKIVQWAAEVAVSEHEGLCVLRTEGRMLWLGQVCGRACGRWGWTGRWGALRAMWILWIPGHPWDRPRREQSPWAYLLRVDLWPLCISVGWGCTVVKGLGTKKGKTKTKTPLL